MRPGAHTVIALVALLATAVPAAAAQIQVLSGNGARAALSELGARFERASGHKVTLKFAVNTQTKRSIEAGERFDVAILNPPVLDDLIRQRRIVAGTRTVLGRSGIGVGVREGASGKYFVSLVDRLGMSADMRPKMRPMPAEYNVEVVARGEADLVVVVASRISGVPGVQLVGRIPQELQTWIGFAAGVATEAREPDAARAMLEFFTTPSAGAVLHATGVEPFVE